MNPKEQAEEIWKDIPGYKSRYAVSNLGRVKSIGRMVAAKNGSKRWVNEKVLVTKCNLYPTVGLYKNNKMKLQRVHRLVAQAFIPNPKNKPQVNHIDGDKRNNIVSNLEWVSGKENTQHAIRTGLATRTGIKNYQKRISKTIIQLDKEGNILNEYDSINHAAKINGFSASHISRCANGGYYRETKDGRKWLKCKTYKGFVWRFKDK